MNSFKCVRAFQIELEFGSVGFWGEWKTGVPGEKPLRARERTNNKLNPHMASTPGFEPGPHRRETSALTTAPPLPDTCLCRIFFSVSALFKFCQILNFVFLETTLTHTNRPFNRLIEGIAPSLRIRFTSGCKKGNHFHIVTTPLFLFAQRS